MKIIFEKKKKGLWANIQAKRKRGETPAKPGEQGYPEKEQWDNLTKEELQEMFKNGKMNKLGLINYEGDCLRATKENNEILIWDQYGVIVGRFDAPQLYGFIDGLINVVDSKGKEWNYPSESKDSKPSYSMIYHFVKDIK